MRNGLVVCRDRARLLRPRPRARHPGDGGWRKPVRAGAPAVALPVYASGFKPAPPKHPGKPGDLPELACAAAIKMGCETDLQQCRMQLREKGDDKLWAMRMGTVIDAKTKKELDDTTVIRAPRATRR